MAAASLQEIIACVGHPVGGNPTQFVMERAFDASGVDSRCLTVDVAPADLPVAMAGMQAMGFRGALLADPHPQHASRLVSRLSDAARLLGEVDLLYRDDLNPTEGMIGDHLVVRAITELLARHLDVEGKSVVVLGRSGLAKAAALAVGLARAGHIMVMDVDNQAAESLVEELRPHVAACLTAQSWLNPYRLPPQTDIVIQAGAPDDHQPSATSPLDFGSLRPEILLLDTTYNPPRTPLLREAQSAGCTTVDGLELLVQKAVAAFQIWTGLPPDPAVVRDAYEEFLLI